MKKIIISALLMAALTGCQETIENVAPAAKAEVFEAVVEEFTADTKTSLTGLNNVVWSEGDNIAIFQGCSVADRYQVTDATAGTGNGKFTIVSDNSGEVNGDFSSGVEIATNIAFYPYAENLSCVNARLTDTETGNEVAAYTVSGVVLPEVQNYTADSFGEGTFPMAAVTATLGDHTLKFRNVCGAMKLQLKGTDIVKSVRIEGRNSEKLSGAATVTAYPTDLAPVITMADNASTSVTLDCGDGVQLNESTPTSFLISLPPVLFTKGFKVTVTTSEDETRTIETASANTVLRSSVLVMPPVMLSEEGAAPEEGNEDELVVPITSITLDKTSISTCPGFTSQITMKSYKPSDATDLSLTWSSSAPEVATVDQSGCVTAISEGTAKIYATSGTATATCTVTVKKLGTVTVEYIDEYGVNHGYGVVLGEQVWAPVNCGYHETNFPYGKLYQWGRQYGQGLGDPYDNGTIELADGGVSLAGGQHKSNADKFYKGSYKWLATEDNTLWNSATGSSPAKGTYDPCPDGWRIPTKTELNVLAANYSGFVTLDSGIKGMYFSGVYEYSETSNSIFLSASGYRKFTGDCSLYDVGNYGLYWSCSPDGGGTNGVLSLDFSRDGLINVHPSYNNYPAYGYSVRCLQE